MLTQSVRQPYPIVATHKANAGNGRTIHNRELSGRLSRNEATAAKTLVARAPSMPRTKSGCRIRSEKSGRTPCAMAMRPRTIAANASQSPARTIGGRRRRTGVAVSTSASIRSGVLEPISKSFEEDHEAGELNEAEEVLAVVLPADEDAALPLDPGEEAFDEPTSHVRLSRLRSCVGILLRLARCGA